MTHNHDQAHFPTLKTKVLKVEMLNTILYYFLLLFPRFSSLSKVMSDQCWRSCCTFSDGKENNNNQNYSITLECVKYISLPGFAKKRNTYHRCITLLVNTIMPTLLGSNYATIRPICGLHTYEIMAEGPWLGVEKYIVYRVLARTAQKIYKRFCRAIYSTRHLIIVKTNTKQERWSSPNFLCGKGNLYTDFSTTAMKFRI